MHSPGIALKCESQDLGPRVRQSHLPLGGKESLDQCHSGSIPGVLDDEIAINHCSGDKLG